MRHFLKNFFLRFWKYEMCRLRAVSYFLQSHWGSASGDVIFIHNEGVSPRRKKNKSRAARDEGVGSSQFLSVPTRPD